MTLSEGLKQRQTFVTLRLRKKSASAVSATINRNIPQTGHNGKIGFILWRFEVFLCLKVRLNSVDKLLKKRSVVNNKDDRLAST